MNFSFRFFCLIASSDFASSLLTTTRLLRRSSLAFLDLGKNISKNYRFFSNGLQRYDFFLNLQTFLQKFFTFFRQYFAIYMLTPWKHATYVKKYFLSILTPPTKPLHCPSQLIRRRIISWLSATYKKSLRRIWGSPLLQSPDNQQLTHHQETKPPQRDQ